MSSIRLGSLNVNGLGKPSKRWDVKRLLLFYNLSIVGLQDVRSSDNNASIQKLKNIYGCPSVWSKHCAILIFDKNIEIKSSHIDFDERVILLSLSIFGVSFSVAVVYAPPQKTEKENFYFKLSTFNWPNNIIFLGDFNCYLNPVIDCYPSSTISKSGAPAFSNFCISANVSDVFYADTPSMQNVSRPTTFSRTFRQNMFISGTRIDAILASNSISSNCTSSEHIPTTFSDHRLVISTWMRFQKPPRQVQFINHKFATNAALSEKIFSTIYPKVARPRLKCALPIQEIWVTSKATIIKVTNSAIKERAAALKCAHRKAVRLLKHLETNSPRVPNPNWTSQWYQAFAKFTRLQRAIEQRSKTLSTYTHLSESETTSPYFLRKFANKFKFVAVSELQDSDGVLHSTPEKLAEISTSFYTQLYADSNVQPPLIEHFLNSIPAPVYNSSNTWDPLIAPITESEISKVLCKYPRKKAAGEDGIPYEVYGSNAPLFTMIFVELFNNCLSNLITLPGSSVSKIILLYKKGNASELKNWRPISLTNTDYKVLTKILNSRLCSIAIDLISPNQFGFIPGRQIWDNIHHVNNLLQSRFTTTNGYALFLDMEKAYDRINWSYLYAALSRFGAPSIFITWLKLLYHNLKSFIIINSGQTKEFPVLQGLRQGDPMSPILFNFAIDFLLRAISNQISGIRLSSGSFISHMAFADDTVVCIGSQRDKLVFKKILDQYQAASNSRVNIDKTIVVKVNNPNFQYSLPPIPPQEIFRHLGVLMTSKGLCVKACENLIISKISSQVSRWSHLNISLSGRCIAANIFLLSRVWYLAHILPFSNQFFQELNRILQKWFWPKNHRAPISLKSLIRHRRLGGLGLLDPVQQSLKILAKWLIPVINPSSLNVNSLPSWVAQTRHNWLRSLGIHTGTRNGIQNFLLDSHSRGPNSLEPIWRLVHNSFKKSPLKLLSAPNPSDRRSTLVILSINNQPLESNQYSIPEDTSPRTPMVVSLDPVRPSFNPIWTKIWYACHSKLVPGFYRTIMWRTLSMSWKSAERMHKESPYYYCPICKDSPSTTVHKYFECPSISFLWQKVWLWLVPSSEIVFNPKSDLFFISTKLPFSFCILVFHCVIGVIHQHFIRATFKDSITSPEILLKIFKSILQAQINRVWYTRDSQIGNRSSVALWPQFLSNVLSISSPKNPPFLIGL